MSTAGRLLSALQGPGNDLITGLIAYDQQRKEAELDRQERSLDREILLAQFEREGQAAKTEVLRAAFDASANRLQSVFDGLRDDTSLAGNEEYSQLMARTNANYLSASNACRSGRGSNRRRAASLCPAMGKSRRLPCS